MSRNKKSPVNPPADNNPEVVAAKAKAASPQSVGAVLAGTDKEAKANPADQEAAATDKYMREHAPLAQDEKPLRNADHPGDEDANANVPEDADTDNQ